MDRVAEDDIGAFSCLVNRYESSVFNYCRRLLGNASDAEEVFQETFVRVYEHRDRYREGARVRPWIYQIATNLCRDRLRFWRRRRKWLAEPLRADLSDNPIEHVANGKAGPDQYARESELLERLEQALGELPIKQRTVFLMARYEGLTYDEIGAALAIPVGTVKSRMNHAVHFLMNELREFLP